MAAGSIVDEQEVRRWISEGRSDEWMAQEYERRYNRVTDPSTFRVVRSRLIPERQPPGGQQSPARSAARAALIPWQVAEEHRYGYPLAMLGVEARLRAQESLRPIDSQRLTAWKLGLHEQDLVVHYDPATVQGWHYVPRRAGVDTDLIRVPDPHNG